MLKTGFICGWSHLFGALLKVILLKSVNNKCFKSALKNTQYMKGPPAWVTFSCQNHWIVSPLCPCQASQWWRGFAGRWCPAWGLTLPLPCTGCLSVWVWWGPASLYCSAGFPLSCGRCSSWRGTEHVPLIIWQQAYFHQPLHKKHSVKFDCN